LVENISTVPPPKNTKVNIEYQKVIILVVFIYSNFFTTTDKDQVGERGPEKKICTQGAERQAEKGCGIKLRNDI
jgi:hypothetical protein